jgi:regulator of RNase E activity RraA
MSSEEQVISWQAIPVSTWSDALDRFRISGIVSGLRHVTGQPTFAGRAVTVLEETADFGLPPDAFDVPAILAAITPGAVAVVAAGGALVSSFGGLAARAAARRGVAGVLVDAGCRDVDEIDAAGVSVWTRHITPVSGKGRLRVLHINQPVNCCGVMVSAGDMVIADRTGIAVVPADRFDEVSAVARDIDTRDRAFARALEEGGDFKAIAASLRHL